MKNILSLCSALLLATLAGCAPAPAASAPVAAPLSMRFDYAGAEAILHAIERDSLSEADVDSLLRVPGVRAMVDNVTRFIPHVGVPQFRTDVRSFARTKEAARSNPFQLYAPWREKERIRTLIATLRADEPRIVREALAQLQPYAPQTGPMTIGVYFVAGGVSTGFAFEDDSRAFYANLARADGDYHGVIWNTVHEAYHVLQMAAQRQSGHFSAWISDDALPPAERLLAGTLLEGTANLVADPTRQTGSGPAIESARARYRMNAAPEQIAANFALFDRTLKELREGTIPFKTASDQGFSGDNPEFYFVGYEMAKAIERHCGARCIGALFRQPPAEFFRRYIALYRAHPEITRRFSRETEAYVASLAGSLDR
ncbi:DUF5700 domain-containing putative Zn-dependent protease [Longimicrobium sp.]|uniref:DUF5700 domain-containing putative Zn-dependent protease n=1 Tax=Longimicrobium sp. TaxID=2029185 RepID=UPI003B3A2D5F